MIAGKEQHTIRKSGKNGRNKKTTLDKYSGYFTVFPCNFKNGETPQKDKPFLYISEKCPEDIKAELLKDWENDTVLFYCAKTLVSPLRKTVRGETSMSEVAQ